MCNLHGRTKASNKRPHACTAYYIIVITFCRSLSAFHLHVRVRYCRVLMQEKLLRDPFRWKSLALTDILKPSTAIRTTRQYSLTFWKMTVSVRRPRYHNMSTGFEHNNHYNNYNSIIPGMVSEIIFCFRNNRKWINQVDSARVQVASHMGTVQHI